ncbi:hypothetical protein [Streptomyces sp. TRM68367]|uniref:hypothetical protein n=1 Tax=Streptomyces sp. TRM68367 TaxID=2758415 RepID=UPI00165BB9C4|nr:hypothetical protein [Streptomyces sp. TRM68367]MBC9725839.1 hypothetical protein [Streptomyces sp. TRM68367]
MSVLPVAAADGGHTDGGGGALAGRRTGQRIGDRFEVSAPGAATQRMVIASKYETGMLRSSPMVAVREGDVKTVKSCVEFAGSGERESSRP